MTSTTLPPSSPRTVAEDISDFTKGLVIVYGADNAIVKSATDSLFTSLRENLSEDSDTTILNFDKNFDIPGADNISTFYKVGVLEEVPAEERDGMLLDIFSGNILNSGDFPPGKKAKWDHIAQNAPDRFLLNALQMAYMGGRLIVSCTASNLSEVIEKLAGHGVMGRAAVVKFVEIVADAESSEAIFKVMDTDTSFWIKNPIPANDIKEDFPSLEAMGGSPEVFETAYNAKSGLILVSGRSQAGKTHAMAALGNQLSRSGHLVLAIKDVHNEIIPGVVNIAVNKYDESLDKAIKERTMGEVFLPEVMLIDDIRSSETAKFAVRMAQSGVLVIASVHGFTPEKGLSFFLSRCETKDYQKALSEVLLLSCGLELVEDDELIVPEEIEWAVRKAEDAFRSANRSSIASHHRGRLTGMGPLMLKTRLLTPDSNMRSYMINYPDGSLGA